MQRDLQFSYAQAGLLFSVPVLMMGLLAIPSGLIMARLGVKVVLLSSLILIGAGGGLRAFTSNAASLFAFTALTGAGIGLLQPALPRLVKDRFTGRSGVVTGLYSTGFTTGAIFGSALAVPVLLPLSGGLSWRGPFLVWSSIVWLTLLGWLFVGGWSARARDSLAPFARVFRNRTCWLASGLFLAQSILFYILNSWLTSYYQTFGFSLAKAASTVALLSGGSIVGAFAGPALSDRTGRRPALFAGAVGALIGIVGLILWPQQGFWLWPAIMGMATAVIFTVCLVVPVDAATSDEVGAFSGLMLTVGYSGVVVGPPLIGFLRDTTGSNFLGLLVMLAIALAQLGLAAIFPETAPQR
jgi:CP family cyanate transporter-like MFS transporter